MTVRAEMYQLGYDSGFRDAEKKYMLDSTWEIAAESTRLPGESPCTFAFGDDGHCVCEVHGWSGPRQQRSRVTVCPEAAGDPGMIAAYRETIAGLDAELREARDFMETYFAQDDEVTRGQVPPVAPTWAHTPENDPAGLYDDQWEPRRS